MIVIASRAAWAIFLFPHPVNSLPELPHIPRRPLAAILAAMVLCLVASCQSTRLPDGRRLWSAKASPSILGDKLLVIFMPDDWPARLSEPDQEMYADWSGLVEEFVGGSDVVKQLRRVDFRAADEVFYGHGLPVNEFTLLFVRGDNMALFAAEPIFDGAVYDYAEAFLGGKEADFEWSGILHAGETEANMPRNLKLVRLRAAPTHVRTGFAVPAPASGHHVPDPAVPVKPAKPVPEEPVPPVLPPVPAGPAPSPSPSPAPLPPPPVSGRDASPLEGSDGAC